MGRVIVSAVLRASILALVLLAGCRTAMTDRADLVFHHGLVLTGDAARPRASALAIRGGRVLAVGADAEVLPLAAPGARVVDLAGRTVLPALTDAHAHLFGLGRALDAVDLRGCDSDEACAHRIAASAHRRDRAAWIVGRGWDQNRFPSGRFPTHDSLDAAIPDRPVWMRRIDGHAGWANRRALDAAGVTAATRDPPGGRIVRDAAGEPTGVLVDEAMTLVERAIPPPSPAEIERAILAAQAVALRHGLTEVHEMGIDEATAGVYRALERAGRLRLRVVAFADGDATWIDRVLARRAERPRPDRRFALAGIKLFADGALGSRGAALLAPYADDPGNTGLVIAGPERVETIARRALASGHQLAVHAIGDRANRNTLDAFERAGCRAGSDHRFRIEHVQVLALDDIARFAALGVIASMQPTHATSDMPWAEARLGRARLAGAYAWRRVLDSGAALAFGSDFPVEQPDPIGGGLYAAVTRTDERGNPAGGWLPDQRLTFEEAVAAFSAGAAYAAFEEGFRGRLVAGQAADLTVVDRDLLAAPPQSLRAAEVDLTIVGGRIEYERAR